MFERSPKPLRRLLALVLMLLVPFLAPFVIAADALFFAVLAAWCRVRATWVSRKELVARYVSHLRWLWAPTRELERRTEAATEEVERIRAALAKRVPDPPVPPPPFRAPKSRGGH